MSMNLRRMGKLTKNYNRHYTGEEGADRERIQRLLCEQ